VVVEFEQILKGITTRPTCVSELIKPANYNSMVRLVALVPQQVKKPEISAGGCWFFVANQPSIEVSPVDGHNPLLGFNRVLLEEIVSEVV